MQGNADITMTWGDGEHYFRLGRKVIQELQEKTGKGPFALYRRIEAGDWTIQDLSETIRLGLIGGGMAPAEAAKLMKNYFDDTPLLQHWPAARNILLAALTGPPDDPIDMGKTKRGNGQSDSLSQPTSESLAS